MHNTICTHMDTANGQMNDKPRTRTRKRKKVACTTNRILIVGVSCHCIFDRFFFGLPCCLLNEPIELCSACMNCCCLLPREQSIFRDLFTVGVDCALVIAPFDTIIACETLKQGNETQCWSMEKAAAT